MPHTSVASSRFEELAAVAGFISLSLTLDNTLGCSDTHTEKHLNRVHRNLKRQGEPYLPLFSFYLCVCFLTSPRRFSTPSLFW